MKPRKDKKPRSFAELRQRELVWILYFTEGYIGNLRHAAAINQVVFTKAEQRALDQIKRRAQQCSDDLRTLLLDGGA